MLSQGFAETLHGVSIFFGSVILQIKHSPTTRSNLALEEEAGNCKDIGFLIIEMRVQHKFTMYFNLEASFWRFLVFLI